MIDLRKQVREKIAELGTKQASAFFGVSSGTISNWASGKTDPSVDAVERVLVDGGMDANPIPQEQQAEPSWDGKDVIIGIPVYRSFNPDSHFSLFANYAKYGPDKIGIIQEKRTLVYEARNIITEKFLATKATYLIMSDDDMIPPSGNVSLFNGRYKAGIPDHKAGLNAITRLMSHGPDKQIVGAAYFGRHSGGKLQCHDGFHSVGFNEQFRRNRVNGLVAQNWVATGFIRIHRSVFEAMDPKIDSNEWPECKPINDERWKGYWTPKRVGQGEDVAFCARAREVGIQPYLDADLICLHAGEVLFGPHNTNGT